jgi:acyl transferase domain-containing protein
MLEFGSIKLNNPNKISRLSEISARDIAIIGMAVRMPQAKNIKEFWDNLVSGVDCIAEFPQCRRQNTDAYLAFSGRAGPEVKYFKGAYLQEIDKFDYEFFNISPKEASLISPNQRLFLEVAWEALEDAGYGGKKIVGSHTGVYLGFEADAPYDYKRFISDVEPDSLSVSVVGNLTPIIASRISYLLDLKGPSLSIDTTCSSSLVAAHAACRSIRSGECEMALVGSVRINFLPLAGYLNFGISSSDGRTKTFDASSDGTGSGEGVVVILLKPYCRAVRDGDHVYAVIKGSSVNHDGNSIGLTAPNVRAQEEVIVNAWKDAEVAPESVSYIEAHGTGTKLGDPIEVDAIYRAFRRYTDQKQFCAIGSLKTNMGHLDNAAGIAGLVKTVLALYHKQLPPTLHFNQPNRAIRFEESPVYVNDRLTAWESDGRPRRGGVSSFGFSGTNCHMVLEEVVRCEDAVADDPIFPQIFTLSAKSRSALAELVKEFGCYLKDQTGNDFRDICYSVNTGRWHYRHRLALIVANKPDLVKKLEQLGFDGFESNLTDVYYGSGDQERKSHAFGFIPPPASEKEYVLRNVSAQEAGQHQAELVELCKAYISGAEIDWEKFYDKKRRNLVSLPTYPFERKRCWLDVPERTSGSSEKIDDLFYSVTWKNKEIETDSWNEDQTIIVLNGNSKRSCRLTRYLKDEYRQVIEVNLGERYSDNGDGKYIIQNNLHDFARLWAGVGNRENLHIVHLLTVYDGKTLETIDEYKLKQQNGIYSLIYLIKAIRQSHSSVDLNLTLVSEYANPVTGDEERIIPENAALFGLSNTLKWELPQIKIRCIDVDTATEERLIIEELKHRPKEHHLAYREGKRLEKTLKKVALDTERTGELNLQPTGVYIITGGTGGVGLEIGRYLAAQKPVNLALLSRSALPGTDWDTFIKEGKDSRTIRAIAGIQAMRANGSKVEHYSVDVTNRNDLLRVINDLRFKYGRINGIIHCAGLGSGNLLHLQEEQEFAAVIAPKMDGTYLLDQLTQDDAMDFLVLFSSAITLIGGLGSGAYTAANAYLDSYASMRSKLGKRTLAINWPAWKDTGLARKFVMDEQKELFKVIEPEEALKAFGRVLAGDFSNIFIGALNLESTVFKLKEFLPFELTNDLKLKIGKNQPQTLGKLRLAGRSLRSEVKLKGKETESYTKIEKEIADIWREVLGYEEIDIRDSFFDMGGDSLLLTRVHEMINELYPGRVTIANLFAFPTIEKLAQNIFSSRSLHQDTLGETPQLTARLRRLVEQMQNGSVSVAEALRTFELIEVTK